MNFQSEINFQLMSDFMRIFFREISYVLKQIDKDICHQYEQTF